MQSDTSKACFWKSEPDETGLKPLFKEFHENNDKWESPCDLMIEKYSQLFTIPVFRGTFEKDLCHPLSINR